MPPDPSAPFTAGAADAPVLRSGLRQGWRGALWMFKIILPVSFATLMLELSGLLGPLEGWLAPAMTLMGLPARAVLPLLAGLTTGIYSAIAVMHVIGLSQRDMTLVAVFLLICHNLVQESAIQGQSGLNPVKAALWRLGAAMAVVAGIGRLWDGGAPAVAAPALGPQAAGFGPALADWGVQVLLLCFQILVVITAIMILLEWMKRKGVIPRIVGALRPLLRLMGLDGQVGMLWLTASLFGLSYGAAVIVEEAGKGQLAPAVLERLQVSIGINHAVVEDPVLFLALGIHPVWLWVPRLLAAAVAVRLLGLWQRIHAGRPRRRSLTP
jgi:spore maturation protein SpmB